MEGVENSNHGQKYFLGFPVLPVGSEVMTQIGQGKCHSLWTPAIILDHRDDQQHHSNSYKIKSKGRHILNRNRIRYCMM